MNGASFARRGVTANHPRVNACGFIRRCDGKTHALVSVRLRPAQIYCIARVNRFCVASKELTLVQPLRRSVIVFRRYRRGRLVRVGPADFHETVVIVGAGLARNVVAGFPGLLDCGLETGIVELFP